MTWAMEIWLATAIRPSRRHTSTSWPRKAFASRIAIRLPAGLFVVGAGLLTGRSPQRSGVYDWIPEGSPVHLRKNELTIATLLKQAGYATCHVGKWHLNGLFNSPQQPQPSDQGFDYWFSTQNNASPSHRDPDNFVAQRSAGRPAGGLFLPIGGGRSDRLAPRAP